MPWPAATRTPKQFRRRSADSENWHRPTISLAGLRALHRRLIHLASRSETGPPTHYSRRCSVSFKRPRRLFSRRRAQLDRRPLKCASAKKTFVGLDINHIVGEFGDLSMRVEVNRSIHRILAERRGSLSHCIPPWVVRRGNLGASDFFFGSPC